MSSECSVLHEWFNDLEKHSFPLNDAAIPLNGIYILFEKGELAHGTNRIVRIGTHTGSDQLRARLKQHFINENKDRSIFRKNIGRCLLNKKKDSFIEEWELDLTTRSAKKKHIDSVDFDKQKNVEKDVSSYIRNNFSFAVFEIVDKKIRLELESRIISTVSLCDECKPSKNWLGLFSPKQKIRESGLWLVNELYKEPLSSQDMKALKSVICVLPADL
jgi:hypothetical protein